MAREALTTPAPFFLRYLLQAGLLATAVAMLLWQKRLVYVLTCGRLVWEYPFEYHYAMCCCLFAVTLIQGTFYPALLPFGWLFLVAKHFVDKFVLLFGHGADQIAPSGQALRDEESELSNRQEMATVSTFLSVMIVIYNLICMAFFTLKTTARVNKFWVVAAGIAFAFSMLLLIQRLSVKLEPRWGLSLS